MSDYPPIGTMRTLFTEKFGVPRQSLMMSEAKGVLKLNVDPAYRVALNHLQDFSHIWIIFVFHQHTEKGWRPTIRPPRLDAPRRVGVFASRSPHRPNPIGLSVVKLDRIDLDAPGGIEIHVSGVDIMDGTPVLDIKPYLPYADSVPEANPGWANGEIPRYEVGFSPHCEELIEKRTSEQYPHFKALLSQMLEWDPRPTSQKRAMPIENIENDGMVFGFRVLEFEVQWQIHQGGILIVNLLSET